MPTDMKEVRVKVSQQTHKKLTKSAKASRRSIYAEAAVLIEMALEVNENLAASPLMIRRPSKPVFEPYNLEAED